ncbi:MAG: pyridoxamine 5'-phosphate oxidase family protein [Pseudomonadota bacterium]
MDQEALETLGTIIATQRWVALATSNKDHTPLVSQVAIAGVAGQPELLMHLSLLAKHTRNLLDRPACSISMSEPDDGRADPQTLARVALTGTASVLEPGTTEFEQARAHYLRRLPDAEPRFDFGDFRLVNVRVANGQYVGGFARAFKVSAADLAAVQAEAPL